MAPTRPPRMAVTSHTPTDESAVPRLSIGFIRVRSRVGMSMGDLPLAVLSPVDLRHTENVPPRLAVDRRLRALSPDGESYVTDHVRGDDLVRVRGAVREGVGEVVEQVAYRLLTDFRTPRGRVRPPAPAWTRSPTAD